MTTIQIDGSDLSELLGKVVIITGGSAGIGFAATKLFAQHGAIVYVGDLKPPPIQFPNTTFLKTNVTSWPDLLNLFTTAYDAHHRIDILIANAGVGEIEDVFRDTFDEEGKLKQPKHVVLDINLKGVMDCVKLAVHFMKKCSGGSIVMTGSTASYLGEPIVSYTAAKHGLLGIMRATHKYLSKSNIRINLVAPWMTESNLMFPALRAALERANIPINDPTSVATALAYNAIKSWSGRTLYVANDTFTELEEGIGRLEPEWLGAVNAAAFRAAEKADYFADLDEQVQKD